MKDWRYKLEKFSERIYIKLAWALPRRIAYWATIRVTTSATVGRWEDQIVPDLTVVQALDRWEDK